MSMSPEQKEERRIKAKMMLDWFDGRELPLSMKLDSARTVLHLPNYVEMHLDWLRKLRVDGLPFKLAYFRLYEVKKLLQKYEESK